MRTETHIRNIKTYIVILLQYYSNIAATFCNIFVILPSCNDIFLQCFCNHSVVYIYFDFIIFSVKFIENSINVN